jgi:hypothetical protein
MKDGGLYRETAREKVRRVDVITAASRTPEIGGEGWSSE